MTGHQVLSGCCIYHAASVILTEKTWGKLLILVGDAVQINSLIYGVQYIGNE